MRLCIPVDALRQHGVVLGKTGAGKSSALRHIVEHLLSNKKRVVIIDPKGDWWGLKASADGKGPGFPIITFGDFKNEDATDVPINPQSGKHVAELISTGNRPAIIGFRGWMTSHMVQFWIDFASTLFRDNQGELYLFIDEAHNFAPKGKIMDPQSGKCLHWSNRLMSEGRGLGLVIWIASQRPQKVHNDTLTSCETLVAMRVIHAADRSAIEDWIKGCGDKEQGKIVLDNLAQVSRGHAFVWSPEIGFGPKLLEFPLFTTFDSFAPPQVQKKVNNRSWADVDLEAVKEKLATVIQEAKSNDPRELRKQIAQLQSTPRVTATEVSNYTREIDSLRRLLEKQRLKPLFSKGEIEKIEHLEGRFQMLVKELCGHLGKFTEALNDASEIALEDPVLKSKVWPGDLTLAGVYRERGTGNMMTDLMAKAMKERKTKSVPHISIEPKENFRRPAASNEASNHPQPTTKAEQRILDSLAWWKPSVPQPTRHQVAFVAGYTVNGHFNNVVGRLKAQGLVEYPHGNALELTAAGLANTEISSEPVTQAALVRKIAGVLRSEPMRRIFTQVATVHFDHDVSREELAAQCGYTVNGHFNNIVGSLKSIGVIEYPGGGNIRLAQWITSIP